MGFYGLFVTANLSTKILDFRGLDSSRILSLRRGILMSVGISPESLSQRNLVGRILVGRLGVASYCGLLSLMPTSVLMPH